MAVETTNRIDIGEYAQQNPDSELLRQLGVAAEDGASPYYSEWWNDLRAEYVAGTLPLDAATAAI